MKYQLNCKGNVILGDNITCGENVVLDAKDGTIRIGDGVVLGQNTRITGGSENKTVIGKYTHIEDDVTITMASIGEYATLKKGASADPFVYTGDYSILEENAHMPENSKLPSRAVGEGDPFSITRGLSAEELEEAKSR
ncbi:hypothetical protein PEPNEM18_01555 [Aedoeadaptatus nemausensis]|uniref:Uncharacterized protein n=1 Tax=Aedoeadaptatus nemausensis TaxID=2582829 RepID=A0A6V6Y6Z1_9FIRM|nr:hypothetical protein [Peptoniphilus nemausensis]CAC9935558.1 hypothetical protein PEPNEM18_01555 [Peptoniphilus nemausensis]